MLNVLPPILDNLAVSLKFEIPEIKETKIKGTATNFSILTNMVPNGITQLVIVLLMPRNTEVIPKRRPKINPIIIFVCNCIFYFIIIGFVNINQL